MTMENNYKVNLLVIEKNRPAVVVIAQSSDHEATDYSGIAQKLQGYGVQALAVIGPVPQWQDTMPAVR